MEIIEKKVKKHFKTWSAFEKFHKKKINNNFKRTIESNILKFNNWLYPLGLQIQIKKRMNLIKKKREKIGIKKESLAKLMKFNNVDEIDKLESNNGKLIHFFEANRILDSILISKQEQELCDKLKYIYNNIVSKEDFIIDDLRHKGLGIVVISKFQYWEVKHREKPVCEFYSSTKSIEINDYQLFNTEAEKVQILIKYLNK